MLCYNPKYLHSMSLSHPAVLGGLEIHFLRWHFLLRVSPSIGIAIYTAQPLPCLRWEMQGMSWLSGDSWRRRGKPRSTQKRIQPQTDRHQRQARHMFYIVCVGCTISKHHNSSNSSASNNNNDSRDVEYTPCETHAPSHRYRWLDGRWRWLATATWLCIMLEQRTQQVIETVETKSRLPLEMRREKRKLSKLFMYR